MRVLCGRDREIAAWSPPDLLMRLIHAGVSVQLSTAGRQSHSTPVFGPNEALPGIVNDAMNDHHSAFMCGTADQLQAHCERNEGSEGHNAVHCQLGYCRMCTSANAGKPTMLAKMPCLPAM